MVTQDTKINRPFSISFQFGMIASILMILVTMSFYWFTDAEFNPNVLILHHTFKIGNWEFLIKLFLLILIMYNGVKRYRDNNNYGYLGFKQCYYTGLYIGIITALVFAIFMIIFTKYIDNDYISFFIKDKESAYKHYFSGIELQHKISSLNKNTTPFSIGVNTLKYYLLISLFLPLLMGVFLKRDKLEEVTNN